MTERLQSAPLPRLLDGVSEAVWLRAPSGRILFANQAMEDLFEVARSELVDDWRGYLRWVAPEDIGPVLAASEEAVRHVTAVNFRILAPGKTPREMRARLIPFHDETGHALLIAGMAEEVPSHEPARAQHQEPLQGAPTMEEAHPAEASFRSILDRITDGFFALDSDWRFRYSNRRCSELLGLTADELFGRTVFDAFPGFRGSRFHQGYEQAIREGRTVEFEAYWEPLAAWYKVHAYPAAGALSVFFQDVTGRRELEQRVADATAQERQRVGAELHDSVCQKLTGIMLLTTALEAEVNAGHQVDPSDIGTISDLLSETITETRRISQGLFPAQLQQEGLPSALQGLCADVEELFGVSCRAEVSPRMTFPLEKSIHLLRIAQELITNAVKHGAAGRICIGLVCTPTGVELRVEHDGQPASERSSPDGLGHRSLEYRAGVLNARLSWAELPDGNTRITCAMPA